MRPDIESLAMLEVGLNWLQGKMAGKNLPAIASQEFSGDHLSASSVFWGVRQANKAGDNLGEMVVMMTKKVLQEDDK